LVCMVRQSYLHRADFATPHLHVSTENSAQPMAAVVPPTEPQ
jgi:hypothetical protein